MRMLVNWTRPLSLQNNRERRAKKMSRMKRSSGKEYSRLSQTGDSDEEVVLYPLAPPFSDTNHLSLSSDSAATTEFGRSHYDTNQDLELPTQPLPRSRRQLVKRRRRRTEGWLNYRRQPLSREVKTCGCFFVLLVFVLLAVTLAWWVLMGYAKSQFLTPPPSPPTISQNSSCPTPLPPSQYSSCPTPFPPSPSLSTSSFSSKIKPSHTIPSTTSAPPPPPPTIVDSGTECEETEIDEVKLHSTVTEQSQLRTPTISTTPLIPSANTLGTSRKPTSTNIYSSSSSSSSSPSSSSSSTNSPPTTVPSGEEDKRNSISWQREYFPSLTETALQLQDLSGDGVSDVILVVGKSACHMIVTVLDGLHGDVIWQANVSYDAFAVRCEVDLNHDGVIDCVAAGRQSGFRALSGINGSTLWDRDPRLAYLLYNFYFPLFIPDQDGDGVQDILITHGGDSTYRERDKDRSPGFLEAVSGRTGQQLMERVLLPDGHETYNSPVLLPRSEEDMILVGSGGETVPGSLWAFSYTSIQQRISTYLEIQRQTNYTVFTDYINHFCEGDVTRKEMEEARPVMEYGSYDLERGVVYDPHLSHCQDWGPHPALWNKYGLCVYRLVTGEEKGVLLPPVVVDMTGDDQYDLVVSMFEGRTLVINGNTAEIVWELNKPGTESYSVPAPLLFNSDSVPDLLVRISYGVWDTYNYSIVAILDGMNGRELWSLGSKRSGMMSSLSIAATPPGNDVAVFVTMGTMHGHTPIEGSMKREVLEMRERRHLGSTQTEGEAAEEEEGGEGGEEEEQREGEGSGGQFIDNFMSAALAYRDPPGLWDDGGQAFPDPVTDFSSFLLDYCGHREEDMTASLFILPPHRASGSPLFSHGPYVYFPGSLEEKRHSEDDENEEGAELHHVGHTSIINASVDSLRRLRCSHIMSPSKVISTPAIGDLDGDGRLEIAYLMSWSGKIEEDDGNTHFLPPQFSIFVHTIEDRVKEMEEEEEEEEGDHRDQWLEGIIPPGQQPWTHYMGTRGDNVYQRYTTT